MFTFVGKPNVARENTKGFGLDFYGCDRQIKVKSCHWVNFPVVNSKTMRQFSRNTQKILFWNPVSLGSQLRRGCIRCIYIHMHMHIYTYQFSINLSLGHLSRNKVILHVYLLLKPFLYLYCNGKQFVSFNFARQGTKTRGEKHASSNGLLDIIMLHGCKTFLAID